RPPRCVAPRRPHRDGRARATRPPRAREGGALPPGRHRRPARGSRHRDRGRPVTSGLAHAGGPIAAAGLALLILATRRDLRLGGLVAWAVGCAGLAVYLAPSGHTKIYAAAVVVGAIGAAAIAWLFHRWPWLIAVSALACAPARIPVHVGSTDSNLLVP